MPPSYGSQEYWEKRFTSETEPFEWLEAPHALDPFIIDALERNSITHPEVLHIGCGTSRLSHHLRTIVKEPSQVHNVDYSQAAIDLGRNREQELLDAEQCTTGPMTLMRWSAINLLEYTSVLGVCKPYNYSIIIDKSTSDSIACSDDVQVSLPYAVDVTTDTPGNLNLEQSPSPIHPLHVMAVHLALLTKPGARWIALSYSSDRFPFVDGLYSSRPHILGFPDTGTLWKLIEKREVESTDETSRAGQEDTVTHRPKVCNWVYVLQRTEVPLMIRGGHI